MDTSSYTSQLKSRYRQISKSSKNHSPQSVVYVMSRDQRVDDNYALYLAQKTAIQQELPLIVVFCLFKTGHRAREHYYYMLQGLKEVESQLGGLNIGFSLLIGRHLEVLPKFISEVKPKAVFFDMNPLIGVKQMQSKLAGLVESDVYVVDTHNIVPVWLASSKQEYSARTIRPKIHSLLDDYLVVPPEIVKHEYTAEKLRLTVPSQEEIDEFLLTIPSNGQKELLKYYPVTNREIHQHLDDFLKSKLATYHSDRNNPNIDGLSGLSPYLHFGRLSAQRVIVEAKVAVSKDIRKQDGLGALMEELIVRKELSDNYCFYNDNYDNLDGCADWAKKTLKKHEYDDREYIYTLKQFESAETHDPAWNAAQIQLLKTGKIHGYMRMYWAKKVLEWTKSADDAIKYLIYLNDFYSIDGGDPNGYAGIMWSVAGVHDRPWGERPVYGTVRSMVYGGLKRKFDIVAYERSQGVLN